MMLDDARVSVMRGASGIAARFPGVVLFCVAGTSDEHVVASVIDHCRAASSSDDPAREMGAAIASLLTDHRSTPPAFAVLARTSTGLAVLVRGAVEAEVRDSGGGTTAIGGLETLTWADRVLRPDFDRITVRVVGVAPEPASPHVNLVEGVVEASGLVLIASESRPPTSSDENATGMSAAVGHVAEPVSDPVSPPHVPNDFESFLLVDHPGGAAMEEPEELEPLPTVGIDEAAPAVGSSAAATGDVLVAGTRCSRGHFNDPRSRFCGSCGIAMVQATWTPVSGARPPLGVLVFEDGATYSLSTSYVIGRQPDISPYVTSGKAQPILLEDDERIVSRAHALIDLVDWDVTVMNLSHTNPTYVWSAEEDRWIALADGEPRVLRPGTRLGFGRRSVVFESARVAPG